MPQERKQTEIIVLPYKPEKVNQLQQDLSAYIIEPKLNGIRAIIRVSPSQNLVTISSATGRNIADNFPEIAAGAKLLFDRGSITLDGEIVHGMGKTNNERDVIIYRRLPASPKTSLAYARIIPCTFIAWDILELNGRNLNNLQLTTRKRILNGLKITHETGMGTMPFRTKNQTDYVQKAKEDGWEGIVAKLKSSLYPIGKPRNKPWIAYKFKSR